MEPVLFFSAQKDNLTIDGQAPDVRLLVVAQKRYGEIRIIYKECDRLSKIIAVLLRILTFGAQRNYLTHYTTVLGRTIYVPSNWHQISAIERYVTLRHEIVHVAQFQRWGWAGMILLYGLLFPAGLAVGRAYLEWEAYRETIAATYEVYGETAIQNPAFKQSIARQFTSGAYAWMWPFPRTVMRIIEREVGRIVRENDSTNKQ